MVLGRVRQGKGIKGLYNYINILLFTEKHHKNLLMFLVLEKRSRGKKI